MEKAYRPLSIAMIGTRGVPARYGGFETCVDEVGSRLAAMGHESPCTAVPTIIRRSNWNKRACASCTSPASGINPWKLSPTPSSPSCMRRFTAMMSIWCSMRPTPRCSAHCAARYEHRHKHGRTGMETVQMGACWEDVLSVRNGPPASSPTASYRTAMAYGATISTPTAMTAPSSPTEPTRRPRIRPDTLNHIT